MHTFLLRSCNLRSFTNLFKDSSEFLKATRNLSTGFKSQSACFDRNICRSTNSCVVHLNKSLSQKVEHVRFLSGVKQGIQESISPLQIKKRPVRKKRLQDEEEKAPGVFNVMAYSTAEEYDLEKLVLGLRNDDLYEPKLIENNPNAVHAIAKYKVGSESREIFFFREGSIVLWNTTELESSNVLSFLKQYEQDSYGEKIVLNEAEYVNYKHYTNG